MEANAAETAPFGARKLSNTGSGCGNANKNGKEGGGEGRERKERTYV